MVSKKATKNKKKNYGLKKGVIKGVIGCYRVLVIKLYASIHHSILQL